MPQLRQEKIAALMRVSVDGGGCDGYGEKLMGVKEVQKAEWTGHSDGWLEREVKKVGQFPRLMA